MVLHICNDYQGSKVHGNLYKSLDQLSIPQIIYCPIKKNIPLKNKNKYKFGEIIYSSRLKRRFRFMFLSKINFLFDDLNRKVDLENIKICHATTLFSDGSLAYRLFKERNIPYIVAVRSTDIEAFLKYRPDLIFLARNILLNCSKIIFISESLKKNFLNHYLIKSFKSSIEDKCTVVLNGIDDFWIERISKQKKVKPTEILYVGSLLKRKNILKLSNSVIALNKENYSCRLHIVGKGGEHELQIKKLAKKFSSQILYYGAVTNKSELVEVFRQTHIFAMPSVGETFGLVYIEALSQGLPILFSKNDGIYGVFKIKIGEYCNPNKTKDIDLSLKKLINNYDSYEINKIDFEKFRWKNIAKEYESLYRL